MFTQDNLNTFLETFADEKRPKMKAVFVESLTNHLNICTHAVSEKNPENLQNSSHDIKSLAYTLDAQELGDLALSIEESVIEGQIDEAFSKAPDMFPLIEHVINVLKS